MRGAGLWLKILLVAFLNVTLLLAAFVIFLRVQFRLDLGSFLLAPARYHMLSVSRLAALELQNMPREKWDDLFSQYSATYPAEFFLFERDGKQVAGKPAQPPAQLFAHRGFGPGHGPGGGRGPFRERDGGGDHHREPAPGPPGPGEFREGPYAIEFERTNNPGYYWAAVHVPVAMVRGERPLDMRLVWRFASLWSNPFFFDYKPWLLSALAIALISVGCWVPLIRSLTRAISGMTWATGQIADGQFEVELPVKRGDELGKLSESINQMARRLSGYVNGQRRFLGDIAHELCSPVARIQMALGIVEQRASEAVRPYVETIDEEVQHMSTLVNELLSFSKASMGASAALEDVNIESTVARAVEREKTDGVTIRVDVPPQLRANAQPDYLFRSISNVLRNAIRYAGSDGPIEISARQIGGFAVVSVADCGPGVPATELETILKPFYRPEAARQRETGGVGLGLAIVQTCMEACGGSVVCRNRVPKGFEVDLRLRSAEAKA